MLALGSDVDDLVVKTVISAEPTFFDEARKNDAAFARGEPVRSYFQLFGFDVMLDAHAKPWLLEVNCDPALGMEAPLDLKIKSAMLVDALNIVAVPTPPAAPLAGTGASDMDRWAADARLGGAAPDKVREWAKHLVDSEYERSQSGGWRRLYPCADRRAKYLSYLQREGRDLNRLDYAGCEPVPATPPEPSIFTW